MRRSRGYLLLPVSLTLAIVALVGYLLAREQSVLRAASSSTLERDQAVLLAQTGLAQQKEALHTNASCAGYANSSSEIGEYSISSVVSPDNGTGVSITTTVNHTASGDEAARINVQDVPVYQGINSMQLQPDASDGKATFISAITSTYNYGARNRLYVGAFEHSLLQFDLATMPGNATILSSALELWMDSLDTGGSIAVHRSTADWNEGTRNGFHLLGANGATWLNRTTVLPWLLAGGDYAPAPEALVSVISAGRAYRFDITRLTRGWYDGTYANQGLLLAAQDGLLDAQPAADDFATASLRPSLRITWGCECGQICVVPMSCDPTTVATAETGSHSYASYAGSTADMAGVDWLLEGERFNGVAAPAGGALLMVDRDAGKAYLVSPAGAELASKLIPHPDPRGIARVRNGTWQDHYAVVDADENRVYFLDETAAIQGSFLMSSYLDEALAVDHIGTSSSGTHDGRLAVTAAKLMTYIFPLWISSSLPGVRIIDQDGNLRATINTGGYAADPVGIAHIPNEDQFWLLDDSGWMYRIDFGGNVLDSYQASSLGLAVGTSMTLSLDNCEHIMADLGDRRIKAFGAP